MVVELILPAPVTETVSVVTSPETCADGNEYEAEAVAAAAGSPNVTEGGTGKCGARCRKHQHRGGKRKAQHVLFNLHCLHEGAPDVA